jgi:hypothetical protein
VSGPAHLPQQPALTNFHISAHSSSEVESDVRKFLAIEEVPEEPVSLWTQEELDCDKHFATTHSRDADGRFVVRLPFKANVTELGHSKGIALRRLFQTESRLVKLPEKREPYTKFMRDYAGLNQMSKVPYLSISGSNYLPHHFVEKPDSSTTKLRVVIDASCKTDSGHSLNDTLMVGPKLQDDLIPLMIRFRLHRIALTTDVEKMFRQILVHPEDRKFQHILWREDFDGPLEDYELNTVTYGTASAPYLAQKCIQQLTKDESTKFPLAATVAAEDAFMDDVVTGAADIEEAKTLQDQLIGLYASGKFPLRKFMSNDPHLLSRIPVNLRAMEQDNVFESDEAYKTLGISWDYKRDKLYYKVPVLVERHKVTKRTISSDIARTFDPLGWISPVIIRHHSSQNPSSKTLE